MKKKITNQDILIDIMLKDIERIPTFIDGKKDLEVWRSIQSILYSVMRLNVNRFLSVQDLIIIDEEIANEFYKIETRVTPKLYSTIIVYVNMQLIDYKKEALALELYEAVANIEKYLTVI